MDSLSQRVEKERPKRPEKSEGLWVERLIRGRVVSVTKNSGEIV